MLPFVNRSPDTADAYLAEALPEQIVGRLARVPGISIKSSTAVAAQWRRTPDPMAAARALRVEWFVTGSLRRVGRQLSVSAELVRVATGNGEWAAPFRRSDDDLAAVEEQIAESVAVAVAGRLAPAAAAQLRRTPTRNTEAYRLYLNGIALTKRRTESEMRRAVAAFTEATRLDPGFAAAWARLSAARGIQYSWEWQEGMSRDSLLRLAAVSASTALSLDSSLAEAWYADGVWAGEARDFGRARSSFERALRIDSLSADLHHYIGVLYNWENLGAGDAEPYLRRALFLDPDLRNTWRHVSIALRYRGRLAEAEAVLDTTLALGPWEPGYSSRAYIRLLRNNPAGALADIAEASRIEGRDTIAMTMEGDRRRMRIIAAVLMGDSAPARAELARLASLPDSSQAVQLARAQVAVVLGLKDAALNAMEGHRNAPAEVPRCGPAACSPSLTTWNVANDPIFAPLRSEPRFQRLLAEVRPRIPWLPGWQ